MNHFENILSENFGDSNGSSKLDMVDAWISAGIEPRTLKSIFDTYSTAFGLEAVVKIYSALLAEARLWLPQGISSPFSRMVLNPRPPSLLWS